MDREITVQEIQSKIIRLPGRPSAMLDRMLAEIYQTDTRSVNQAAKRNPKRFPSDFRFQLTDDETGVLVSQSVISRQSVAKSNPYAYTREGCNMMSACLETSVAIERSVFIMRAFSAMEAQASRPYPDGRMTMEQLETALRCYKISLEILELLLSPKKSVARPVANNMTRDVIGTDLMDFVYPYLFSATKHAEAFSSPVEDGDEEDALIFFLTEWLNTYGGKPVSSRELCDMIDDEGVPLDLGAGSDHSRKVRLGKMLARLAGREIGDYRISDAGKRKSVRVWRLEEV